MQKSMDMESFTGLVPAIYSLFHERERKLSDPLQPNLKYGAKNHSNALHIHGSEPQGHKGDECKDVQRSADVKTANESSDWTLVRQSSIDQLISRSTRGTGYLDVHTTCKIQNNWPYIPAPCRMYAKLKKKMKRVVVSTSSAQLQRNHSRHRHRLNDSNRFEGSSYDADVLEATSDI